MLGTFGGASVTARHRGRDRLVSDQHAGHRDRRGRHRVSDRAARRRWRRRLDESAAGAAGADSAAAGAAASAVEAGAAVVAAGAAAAAASAAAERRDDGEHRSACFGICSRPAGACVARSTRPRCRPSSRRLPTPSAPMAARSASRSRRVASALDLMRGITPRQQALQAFARLGVWDTDANNGVLIYVSWADRDVEIVADRGFNGRVSAAGMDGSVSPHGAIVRTRRAAAGRRRGRPGRRCADRAAFPGGGPRRTAEPAGDAVGGRLADMLDPANRVIMPP